MASCGHTHALMQNVVYMLALAVLVVLVMWLDSFVMVFITYCVSLLIKTTQSQQFYALPLLH